MAFQDTIGLGLSGGGSRAAAFHRGTVRAAIDLGLLPDVTTVSTVSGGSVFGAAWMAGRVKGQSDDDFLQFMKDELEKGFIKRSLGWRAWRTLLPGYNRTDLIASTFDRYLCHGLRLDQLPTAPTLCVNTTVLNTGQVGKFTHEGFSTFGLGQRQPNGSNQRVPVPQIPLSLAAAASAAYPFGLPAVTMKRKKHFADIPFTYGLTGHDEIVLVDGGILENLGAQTLIKSRGYGTWNLIISDAGTKEKPWKRRTIRDRLRSFGAYALSASMLEQLLLVMNNKTTRFIRSATIEEANRSRLAALLRNTNPPDLDDCRAMLADLPDHPARKLLFVRANQQWDRMLHNIPAWRLRQLGIDPAVKAHGTPDIQAGLSGAGIDLGPAQDVYSKLGGDKGVESVNNVGTGFSGLSEKTLDELSLQAQWQMLAQHAIYWKT